MVATESRALPDEDRGAPRHGEIDEIKSDNLLDLPTAVRGVASMVTKKLRNVRAAANSACSRRR